MSASTRIWGVKPPDARWLKMKAIYDSCTAAYVAIPAEVSKFFEGDEPDDDGVTIELGSSYMGKEERHPCCTTFRSMGASGFSIDLTKLPADIKIIRFENSW